ncbi:hypothetical protein PDR5_39720 [Pseudomonas sp. DR 5-09]|nr:hypothetical protein PDR5_39720 [Pseudomonas sp. DR 5-09]
MWKPCAKSPQPHQSAWVNAFVDFMTQALAAAPELQPVK